MLGLLLQAKEEIELGLAPGPMGNLLKSLRGIGWDWAGPWVLVTDRGLLLDVLQHEVGYILREVRQSMGRQWCKRHCQGAQGPGIFEQGAGRHGYGGQRSGPPAGQRQQTGPIQEGHGG